jgi:integrase
MQERNESPVKCVGKRGVTWKARYTNRDGKRVSAGTFKRCGPCRAPHTREDGQCCAQHAIWAAYSAEDDEPVEPSTIGEYAATWAKRYPRSPDTNTTNSRRIKALLDEDLHGRKLRDWPYSELRRKHGADLLAIALGQGRAAEGARGLMRTYSTMTEDAIRDELAEVNPFHGLTIRDDDERVQKPAREPRVYSFEQMHSFAAGSPRYEAMIRTMADCGWRLGELFALDRVDLEVDAHGMAWLQCRGTTNSKGVFVPGNARTKKHVRKVPVAPTTAGLIAPRIDTKVLFATPHGMRWVHTNFYRRVWGPAREACPEMADAVPQDFRHSWVTHLRAAGVDPADLASMAGHTVETADAHYVHALNRSADAVRNAIG